jgi:hypothetical protein
MKMSKTKYGILSLLTVATLAAGCASFNATTFNTEKLAVDSATTATHEFNQYYQTATNGATDAQVAKLNSFRDQIYAADKDLSKALFALDAARIDYAANAADTNKTAVMAAVQTVSDQSGSIVALIKEFTASQPKPAPKAPATK